MKIIYTFLIALMVMSIMPVYSYAKLNEMTVDDLLKHPNLPPGIRDQIVNSLNKDQNKTSPPIDVSQAKEWKEFVQIFSETLKDICHNLNVEVNEFIKTPVGYITIGVIAYKIFGKTIVELFSHGSAIIFLLITQTILTYMLYAKRKIVRDDKSVKYENLIKMDDEDARTCVFIISIIIMVVVCIVLFCTIG